MKLIPALFDDLQISEKLPKLIALPWKPGSMRIINSLDNASEEYKNSNELTNKVKNSIMQQEH